METPQSIVAECLKRGMSQIEISRASGLGRSYISLLVSGNRGNGRVTVATLAALGAALRIARRKRQSTIRRKQTVEAKVSA